MAEKVLVAASRLQEKTDTVFCATRYGNVMASRGSVIPLFVKQIKNHTDITITDPNMTRFLMSLEDSVDLVLHAFKHGNQGDIFVQKAPATTVETLALALKDLFDSKSLVRTIGTRHGEKLFESLVSREEMAHVDDMGGYYRIPADNRDLNYSKFFSEGDFSVSESIEYTSHNTTRLEVEQTKELLLSLEFIRNELNA
jgi:UDP-glucose 4-epimerase